MKKLLMFGIIAVMAFGAYFAVVSTSDQRNDLISQDVQALSDSEDGPSIKRCGMIWGRGCFSDNYGNRCLKQEECGRRD